MDLPNTFLPGFHDANIVSKMEYRKFGNTGMQVSVLSLGAATFSNEYGDYSVEECRETLISALKSGINYIDTAPWYGSGVSEQVLGECLRGIPRETFYIATKVGRYEKDPKRMFDFSAKKTRESVETSLKKLGLDYVDVIQVHDVEFAPSLDILYKETLPAVEEFVKTGKAKYIGVTGYPVSTLKEFVEHSNIRIDSVLSYTRLTLIDNTLKDYLPFFQSKNMGIVNASVNCMGLLTNGGPQPWHPAYPDIKEICDEARNYCKDNKVELAKLALYYCLQQEGPHTHLVGMNTKQLLECNLQVVYNGLSEKEKHILEYLKANVFSKLKRVHWEGKEVEDFKKLLEA